MPVLTAKNPSWKPMLNLDQSPKGSGAAFPIGTVFGWVYYLISLLDLKTFGWEFIVKLVTGVISAVTIGLCVKVSLDFYEKKLKHRIFRESKPKIEKTI